MLMIHGNRTKNTLGQGPHQASPEKPGTSFLVGPEVASSVVFACSRAQITDSSSPLG